jgi:hypothetical protein
MACVCRSQVCVQGFIKIRKSVQLLLGGQKHGTITSLAYISSQNLESEFKSFL